MPAYPVWHTRYCTYCSKKGLHILCTTYDPGISPGSANQCIFGDMYLRSDLSRVHGFAYSICCGPKTSACTVKTLQFMAASTLGVSQIAQVSVACIMHHHSELRPSVADKRRPLKTCSLSSELIVCCTVNFMSSLVLIILYLNNNLDSSVHSQAIISRTPATSWLHTGKSMLYSFAICDPCEAAKCCLLKGH